MLVMRFTIGFFSTCLTLKAFIHFTLCFLEHLLSTKAVHAFYPKFFYYAIYTKAISAFYTRFFLRTCFTLKQFMHFILHLSQGVFFTEILHAIFTWIYLALFCINCTKQIHANSTNCFHVFYPAKFLAIHFPLKLFMHFTIEVFSHAFSTKSLHVFNTPCF